MTKTELRGLVERLPDDTVHSAAVLLHILADRRIDPDIRSGKSGSSLASGRRG